MASKFNIGSFVASFEASPSESKLDALKRNELFDLAKHYNVSGYFSVIPTPTRKFNFEGKKKDDCLIVKERKTFAPGMHISILKERKSLIV